MNQQELARAIGRKQPWLHKYINGQGHATIDDLVRMAAALIGFEQPISEVERRILRAVRVMPEDRQEDAATSLEATARRYRKNSTPHPGSGAQTIQTPERATKTTR